MGTHVSTMPGCGQAAKMPSLAMSILVKGQQRQHGYGLAKDLRWRQPGAAIHRLRITCHDLRRWRAARQFDFPFKRMDALRQSA